MLATKFFQTYTIYWWRHSYRVYLFKKFIMAAVYSQPQTSLPWKSLGVGQLLLFLLSICAFVDMRTKMDNARYECGCASNENEIRDKRSLKGGDDIRCVHIHFNSSESLFNLTDSKHGKKELWVHSLSKIQMDELLEKCLGVHEYCTSEKDNTRGARILFVLSSTNSFFQPPGPPISFIADCAPF